MKEKFLRVNWRAIEGSAKAKKILRLRADSDGNFSCPVPNCMHLGFRSSRGLRRHIDTRHSWLYWFSSEPSVNRNQLASDPEKIGSKAVTHNIPSFSIDEGVGATFCRWLRAPLGGGKNEREAVQGARRAMKFLLHVMGDDCIGGSMACMDFIDCAVGSASTITKFLETITVDWRMTSSGALNYLKSITDLVDFRKSQGCPDTVLRALSVTEVYLRRGRENLRRKKAVEYTRNLDLETLIMKDSWCSLEDMNKVIPYHINQFKEVYNKCNDSPPTASINDLAFATRFIATYLFLMVKCSRPRTFQFLTIGMVKKSKENGGFIDSTEFKTASTYIFDTLIMSEQVLKLLDMYINTIRPKMTPKCEYVLVSTTGRQYTSFTVAMTLLVKQAIGKYVHPTRFRQIVETSSSERLSPQDQDIVTADQKHRSNVARLSYKKKLSREVATKGKECMKKMLGTNLSDSTAEIDRVLSSDSTNGNVPALPEIMTSLAESMDSIDEAVIEKTKEILSVSTASSKSPNCTIDVATTSVDVQRIEEASVMIDPISNLTSSPDVEYTGEVKGDGTAPPIKVDSDPELPTWPSSSQPIVDVKVEESTSSIARARKETVKFVQTEDEALISGVMKYGHGQWGKILADSSLQFNPCRDRDALRSRWKSKHVKRLLRAGKK
jgi:hypothetical protein